MLDLAATLGAPVLLVAGSYLGTISHTLTAAAVIEAAGLALAAVVMSESGVDAPPLDETVTAVAARLQPALVTGLKRGQTMNAAMLAGVCVPRARPGNARNLLNGRSCACRAR